MGTDIRNLKIGSLTLDKGQIRENVTMFAWDGIQQCSGGEIDPENLNDPTLCPANHLCSYMKRGKCAVQVKYLEALYGSILGTYHYLDEPMLFKIGMQIIPLYVHLVKLQIVELSLHNPTYLSDKGTVLIHPIYKEIRETLKAIHVMWKDLDLTFTFNKKPGMKGTAEDPEVIDNGRSDPAFYKRLTEDNTASMKGVIR